MAKTDMSDDEYVEEAKELLAALGIELPDHTTPETFLRDLVVAGCAVRGAKDDDDEEDDEDEDDGELFRETPTGAGGMMMSLTKRIEALEATNGVSLPGGKVTPERARAAAAEIARNCGLTRR